VRVLPETHRKKQDVLAGPKIPSAFGHDFHEAKMDFSAAEEDPKASEWEKALVSKRVHIPEALRGEKGASEAQSKNRAMNFSCLIRAAQNCGMDRFTSQAVAAYVLDRSKTIGSGSVAIEQVEIKPSMPGTALEITCVNRDSSATSIDDPTQLPIEPEMMTVPIGSIRDYKFSALDRDIVNRQLVGTLLFDEKDGRASFDGKTGTVFVQKRLENGENVHLVTVAFFPAGELFTDAEQEILEIAASNEEIAKRRMHDLLKDKAFCFENVAWNNVQLLKQEERSVNNLSTLAQRFAGGKSGEHIATKLDTVETELDSEIHEAWMVAAVRAAKDVFQNQLTEEGKGLFGWIRKHVEHPVDMDRANQTIEEDIRRTYEHCPANPNGEVLHLRLQEEMTKDRIPFVFAVVEMAPCIETQTIGFSDPRFDVNRKISVTVPEVRLAPIRKEIRVPVGVRSDKPPVVDIKL